MAKRKTKQQTIEELQVRLQEMEETLQAIRSGAVDAIVASGPAGDRVYTLEGADHAYHVMVETMNEGAVTLSMDGTILYANSQFGQMAGVSASGIIGRRFHEFVHASDHPVLDTIIEKGGHDCPKAEITLFSEAAAEIPAQIAASPIELGGAKALTLVITDLSEQRRYEEIVAAENLSRRILEQAQEAIAVCIDGCIVRANRALYEICGCVPLMQPFDRIFSLRMSESQTFSIAMPESGNTIRNQEVSYQRTDGKRFSLILNAGPLVGKDSKVLGTLITLVNVTERKRAEESVRESEARLTEVLNSITDGYYVLDSEWRFVELNPVAARHFGYPAEELRGRNIWELRKMPPDAAVYQQFHRAVRENLPAHFEAESRINPGAWSELHLYPSEGRLDVYFRDITERKRAEMALQEANLTLEQRVRERTMNLQNLTEQLERSRHDLRNLASELVMTEERERKRIAGVLHDEIAQTLAAVRMRLDLLRDVPSDQKDKTLQEARELLLESIHETRALMNDLGNPILFDLGLRSACEALANRLMERSPTRISCDIQEPYKNLDSDTKMIMYQAVRELLNNIVKHSNALNAHVQIDTENEHYRVKVTDDGVGFKPEEIGPPTAEGGFGLYSMRERLIAVDGSLLIESFPGTGTVVTFVLPSSMGKAK